MFIFRSKSQMRSGCRLQQMVTVPPKNQTAAGQGQWKNGLAECGGGEVHESGGKPLMTDGSHGEGRQTGGRDGSFWLRRSFSKKLLALRFFSPPLARRNGCRFGFSRQAQSCTEMLTLMCLMQRQGLSDRDVVHAPRPGSSPGRFPGSADSH